MELNKNNNDYSNAFKLATENNDNSAVNNIDSARNDDSAINSAKRKKKSIKNKSEINVKPKSKLSGKFTF
jgi:hypothetical protein